MPQSLQIVFHGINRSPAVETAVTEKVEALRRFDNQLGACKVTVSQEGHQTMGAFTIRIDLMASGQELIVNRTNIKKAPACLSGAFGDPVRPFRYGRRSFH